MSDQQRQHLSALVDDEIDPALVHATVSALESSSGLRETWERYHLIGAAIRSEPVREEYREIATRVKALIADEKMPSTSGRFGWNRLTKRTPAAGIALVASAAFFALLALPYVTYNPTDPEVPIDSRYASSPPEQFQLSRPTQRWHVDEPDLEKKLDRFLVNHQEQSPTSGIKGFLPYATVVGYAAR